MFQTPQSPLDPQPVREFFERLFGDEVTPERQLVIAWQPPAGGFRHGRHGSIEAAVQAVARHAGNAHVWFGNSLMTGLSGDEAGRGTRANACCLGALWVDLDCRSAAHPREDLPGEAEGLEFLETLPHPPTLIVHTGFGFHAYWLLEQPWLFLTEKERDEAERHTRGWHEYVGRQARERGWKLENVGDLPRVLRVPGTWNRKRGGAREVVVVRDEGGPYLLSDFTPWLVAAERPAAHPPGAYAAYDTDRAVIRCIRVRGVADEVADEEEEIQRGLFRAAERYLAAVPPCPEGLRNSSAFSLAGHLAAFVCAETGERLRAESVRELVGQWNARNQPPLPAPELARAVDNALRHGIPRATKPVGENSANEKTSEQGSVEWGEVLPWEQSPPDFPLDILPEELRAWCAAEAETTQPPPDLPGLLTLAACSVALAGKTRVQVTADWREPVNLYTVVVLEPGNRKSAVFSHVQQPLADWEQRENLRLGAAIQQSELERTILEKRLTRLLDEAVKKSAPEDRAQLLAEAELVREELRSRTWLTWRKLFADNVTNEKLGVLLAEQHERLAVFSPEGNVFQILAGLYSRRPEFEIYLKGHAGDSMRIDRLGREPVYLERPALTLGLTVQEEVLRGLGANPTFRGQGLLARFLFALPESRLGSRNVNPAPMPEPVQQAYVRRMHALCDCGPVLLSLEDGALARLREFAAELEPMLRVDGSGHAIQDWLAKLAGAVVRVAGLLERAERPESERVVTVSLERAVTLGRYLLAHARQAFDLIDSAGGVNDARYLLRRLQESHLTWFTRREAQRFNTRRFRRVADLQPALDELLLRNMIREVPARPGEPFRYELNPACRF